MVVQHRAAAVAVSWIDRRTGLLEVDNIPPGERISREYAVGNSGYRFTNLLDVWATYDEGAGAVVGHGFSGQSGIYRAPSYARVPSHVFPKRTQVNVGNEPISFVQIVGARTVSPETIGGAAGGAAGGAVGAAAGRWGGAWAGARMGATMGSRAGAYGLAAGVVVGGVIGAVAGDAVAHRATGFPPIWSELKISIFNDGRVVADLLRYSLFPSLSFYAPGGAPDPATFTRLAMPNGAAFYDAVDHLERWKLEGWGPMRGAHTSGPTAGNPWGELRGIL